jgi:hypothetical protein
MGLMESDELNIIVTEAIMAWFEAQSRQVFHLYRGKLQILSPKEVSFPFQSLTRDPQHAKQQFCPPGPRLYTYFLLAQLCFPNMKVIETYFDFENITFTVK